MASNCLQRRKVCRLPDRSWKQRSGFHREVEQRMVGHRSTELSRKAFRRGKGNLGVERRRGLSRKGFLPEPRNEGRQAFDADDSTGPGRVAPEHQSVIRKRGDVRGNLGVLAAICANIQIFQTETLPRFRRSGETSHHPGLKGSGSGPSRDGTLPGGSTLKASASACRPRHPRDVFYRFRGRCSVMSTLGGPHAR